MKQQKSLKILNSLFFGKKLKNIYYSSFYIGNELINLFNVLYLKFDNIWFHCTICEGIVDINEISKPNLISLKDISDEFKYPIIKLNNKNIKINFYNKEFNSLTISIVKDCFGLLFLFKDSDNNIFYCENTINETNNLIIIDSKAIKINTIN